MNRIINSSGYTLIETLVVLGIVGIVAGIATPSLFQLNKPLKHATLSIESHVALMRGRAIATGRAHRLVMRSESSTGFEIAYNPLSSYLAVESANDCNSTVWKPVNDLDLELPSKITVISHLSLLRSFNRFCVNKQGVFPIGQNGHYNTFGFFAIVLYDFSQNNAIKMSGLSIVLGGRVNINTFRCGDGSIYVCTLEPRDTNDNPVFQ